MTVFSCKEKKTGVEIQKAENSIPIEAGFISLFNGKDLKGWEGDRTIWRAENGILIGELDPITNLKNNTFLIWKDGEPQDFELQLDFRISESGNSGINYRSDILDSIPFALRGYQADIDGKNNYTGQNYEERKRTTLAYRGEKAVIASQPNPDQPNSLRENIRNNAWQSREILENLGNPDILKDKINKQGWNSCKLIVNGNTLQHYVNGVLMSEVIDKDSLNRKLSGHLGLQIHVGPPMKVEYRNIRLKNL
ncbi:hypothetical protein GCM10007383_33470 [Arenibacter certesii]|uniref:3-keto-alpha-glucoside-1,2-lyase/3-keto-2-hydroxy-glucal hydratase domain-containing protein n=2 Tax=Arenibacter certesii TaxID=228955 RepID=A0A918J3S7_9FLAO|nr:hypothetical protein GCM10007383_33470 [Arenibacter certesii]